MANEKALWIRRPGENEPYHRLRLHTVCPPSRRIAPLLSNGPRTVEGTL